MTQPQEVRPVYTSRFHCSSKTRLGAAANTLGILLLFLLPLGFIFGTLPYLPELLDGSWPTTIRVIIVLFFNGWFLLLTGGSLYTCCTTCRIEQDGLWVRPPFQKERCIPWAGFRRVCVCTTKAGRGFQRTPVIYCVQHSAAIFPKEEHPPMFSAWPFSRRGVILLNYSEGLLAGLKERCPLPVEDLR